MSESSPKARISSVRSIQVGMIYSSIRNNFNVVSTVGTQFAIFALHALHSVVLARMLGPVGRGEYGTVMFYSQTLMYAGMFGTSFVVARYAQTKDARLLPLSNAAMRVGLATGLASLLVAWLAALIGLPADKSYLIPYCLAVAWLLPLEHIRLSLLSIDHGTSNFRRYNSNRLLAAIGFPILLLALWFLGQSTLSAIVLAVLLSAFLSLVWLMHSHGLQCLRTTHAPAVSRLLREAIPYGASYFAGLLLGRMDVWLSIWFMTLAAQGQYAVALAVVGLMQLAPNAFSLFSFNAGANLQQPLTTRELSRYALKILGLQAATATGFALIIPYLIPFAFGLEFRDAIWMAMILLPGLAIDGLANVTESYARGKGYPLSTLWPKLFAAVLLVAVAAGLRSDAGMLAVPIAAGLAHMVNGVLTCAIVLRISMQPHAHGDVTQ